MTEMGYLHQSAAAKKKRKKKYISHGCSGVTPETVTFRPKDTTQNRTAKTIIKFDVTVKKKERDLI